MNKAPVLTEFTLLELDKDLIITQERIQSIPFLVSGMTAQRDADAMWYEAERDESCACCALPLLEIEQAKQETAREIFEEAETPCIHYGDKQNRWVKRCCDDCWQSLKDRYTAYCIDCNREVAVKLEDCPKFKEEK